MCSQQPAIRGGGGGVIEREGRRQQGGLLVKRVVNPRRLTRCGGREKRVGRQGGEAGERRRCIGRGEKKMGHGDSNGRRCEYGGGGSEPAAMAWRAGGRRRGARRRRREGVEWGEKDGVMKGVIWFC